MPKKASLASKSDSLIRGKPRFTQWLYFARDRKDDVGEVARFAFADRKVGEGSCWPMQASSLSHFLIHLRDVHYREKGKPSEIAVRDAYAEFRRFMENDGKMPARQGGIEKTDNPRTHRGYVILPETVERIRVIADATGATQGAVIERLVNSEYRRKQARGKAKA